MKKKFLWTCLILILAVVLLFGAFHNREFGQSQEDNPLLTFLNEQYNNKYLVKSFDPIGDNLIVSANSNTSCCGENSTDDIDQKATPSIIISDSKSMKIKSIYNVSFTNSGKEETGNILHLVTAKRVNDAFIAEWQLFYGGSSGLKGLAIFREKDGIIQPVSGYPGEVSEESSLNLTEKITGKKYSFPITIDSYLTEVKDLNKDGNLDFLSGTWEWNLSKGESHYQDRPWELKAYELIDNKFKIAEWWNKGEPYKTPKSYGYGEEDNIGLLQVFYDVYKPRL